MNRPAVDYTVVLIFPGFGAEREFAEDVIEGALEWLNTYKDEPGMRFAPHVSAHLEIVHDADAARERIANDAQVALIIAHGLDDDERDDLFRECEAQNISRCTTVETVESDRPKPRPDPRRRRELKVVFRRRDPDEISAHTLSDETLTAPLDDDEAVADRVGQLICVLALGVMEHHWTNEKVW
jgi:hypothetical protein